MVQQRSSPSRTSSHFLQDLFGRFLRFSLGNGFAFHEGAEIIASAKRVAFALIKTYQPLGILTFQNNGVYSGQEVPHYHFHVVPRQPGSDWGIGPPQLAFFESAGRIRGTPHDASKDEERRQRAQVDGAKLRETAKLIRPNLPV